MVVLNVTQYCVTYSVFVCYIVIIVILLCNSKVVRVFDMVTLNKE